MSSVRFTGPISRKISRRVLVCTPTYSEILWFLNFPRTDPALVWSEFLGVISGSEGSLATENGYMDRATWTASRMKSSAIERRRRFRGSAGLSIVSFKRTYAERENWKGMMSPTGLYKLRNRFSLHFDTCDPQDTCALAGDSS